MSSSDDEANRMQDDEIEEIAQEELEPIMTHEIDEEPHRIENEDDDRTAIRNTLEPMVARLTRMDELNERIRAIFPTELREPYIQIMNYLAPLQERDFPKYVEFMKLTVDMGDVIREFGIVPSFYI